MNASLLIFIATTISVLAIGVEMRAIAKKQIFLAVLTSCIVAGGQLVALKLVPSSTDMWDYISYLLGNAVGMLLSFSVHDRLSMKQPLEKEFEYPFESCHNRAICPYSGNSCDKKIETCPVHMFFFKNKEDAKTFMTKNDDHRT